MASTPPVYPSCQLPHDTHRDGLPLIYGENVSRIFNGKTIVTAVSDMTFGMEAGRITAIVGESGSGKSTLLRLIYGLLEPDGGEIRFRGWRVPGPRDKLIPGHEAMRMVTQGFDDLNAFANVWDNVASQLPNTDLESKQRKTEDALRRLRISQLGTQRIADLSGGEKQRVALARALVTEPEVLLLDEPFNQVDAAFRDRLQQDIRAIVAETGLTVVFVSHDPAEVLALADQILVLRSGRLIAAAAPDELYNRPPDGYTARLLAQSNVLSREAAATLGITTEVPVAIHPEWMTLTAAGASPSKFVVTEVSFRGFYQTVTVLPDSDAPCPPLRVIVPPAGNLTAGSDVSVQVNRFHPLSR